MYIYINIFTCSERGREKERERERTDVKYV